jgi:tetratricopeptide (TPR) repeat protein
MSDPQFNQTSHGPGSAMSGDGGSSTVNNYFGVQPPQPPSPTRAIHLPQRKANFIGREDELNALERHLNSPGSLSAVCGVAGRGKTSLALEYAHRHAEDFDSVHWLPCHERSLAQIAGELAFQLDLKPEGDADALVRELNFHCARKRCLLVLDNVDDETPAPLVSTAGRASVLVTTRVRTLRFLSHHHSLALPLFTEEQCFELFRTRLGKDEVNRHAADAIAIFTRLEYLPIGISVAAGLLHDDPFLTIDGMARNPPADVYALLVEAIAALSPATQSLLAAMAVCAPEGFRLALAQQVSELDTQTAQMAIRDLYSRSLVELVDKDSQRYRLHAMVRDAAGEDEELCARHAASVQKTFASWETNWTACREEMAEFQAAFQWLVRQSDEKFWSDLNILAYAAECLAARVGAPSEAFEICQSMAKQAQARGDAQRLQAWYGNQALILRAWGRLDEALELLKKGEAICLELGNRRSLAICYWNWGLLARQRGDANTGREKLERARALFAELKMPRELAAVQTELEKTNSGEPAS